MSPNWDLLFCNVLYPDSPDFTSWKIGDIATTGCQIAVIEPDLPDSAFRRVEGSGLLAIPGLYNMHTHAYNMLLRGAQEVSALDDPPPGWFQEAYSRLTLDNCRAASHAAYLDSMLSGTTFVVDHLRSDFPSKPFTETMATIGLPGFVHASLKNIDEAAIILPHETHPEFEASIELAARSPRRPTMMHAQETAQRLEHVHKSTGYSTIEFLDLHKLLDHQMFLVHLCEHSNSDLDLIASRGAHVVITPTAEMKLGEKTLDFQSAMSHGIRPLIGTDGPAYNNSNSLWGDMKLLALLWAQLHGPASVKIEQILAAATCHAAMATCRQGGVLAPGYLADITFLNRNSLALQPLVKEPFGNIPTQLIFSAEKSDVKYVLANGRLLLDNGVSARNSIEGALTELRRATSDYFFLA